MEQKQKACCSAHINSSGSLRLQHRAPWQLCHKEALSSSTRGDAQSLILLRWLAPSLTSLFSEKTVVSFLPPACLLLFSSCSSILGSGVGSGYCSSCSGFRVWSFEVEPCRAWPLAPRGPAARCFASACWVAPNWHASGPRWKPRQHPWLSGAAGLPCDPSLWGWGGSVSSGKIFCSCSVCRDPGASAPPPVASSESPAPLVDVCRGTAGCLDIPCGRLWQRTDSR